MAGSDCEASEGEAWEKTLVVDDTEVLGCDTCRSSCEYDIASSIIAESEMTFSTAAAEILSSEELAGIFLFLFSYGRVSVNEDGAT